MAVSVIGVLPGMVATGAGSLLVEQDGRGIPGSEVTCQQEIKPLAKIHSATARIAPAPTMIHWKTDGLPNAPGLRSR
jgi:hypothetical protein